MNLKLGAAIAIAVPVVLWGLDRKAKKEKELLAAQKAEEERQRASNSGQTSGPSPAELAYREKVRQFQALMGIGIDGSVGNDTLTAAKSLGFSILSSANIDAAIAAAKAKAAAKTTTSTQVQRATEIYNAMASGTGAKFRIKTQAAAMFFDVSKNQFLPTGGYFYIDPGAVFYKSQIKNDPRKNGVFTVEMQIWYNGSKITKLLQFGPSNLYV